MTTPFWLNPALEVTDVNEPQHPDKAGFIQRVTYTLLDLGVPLIRVFEVAANCMAETGWGRHYRGNNLGGVKIWRSTATPESRWFQAPGHQASGDPPICYYRAWPSYREFFRYWLGCFTPPVNTVPHSRYRKTGDVFWGAVPGDWFAELIAAGYKGDVTKAHPSQSIHDLHEIAATVRTYWVQDRLGLVQDGVWGPRSTHACAAWQAAQGIAATGTPDDATILAFDSVRAKIRLAPIEPVEPRTLVLVSRTTAVESTPAAKPSGKTAETNSPVRPVVEAKPQGKTVEKSSGAKEKAVEPPAPAKEPATDAVAEAPDPTGR